MSDSLENLRRKIDGATELESVVRTMKALACFQVPGVAGLEPAQIG